MVNLDGDLLMTINENRRGLDYPFRENPVNDIPEQAINRNVVFQRIAADGVGRGWFQPDGLADRALFL